MIEKFECPCCSYVYNGEKMPFDFRCPVCRTSGALFKEIETEEQSVPPERETGQNPGTYCTDEISKKALTNAECKEYVGRIKDLEISCYQLDKLRNNMYRKLNQLEREHQKKAAVKPEGRPEERGTQQNFLISLVAAIIAALVGIIPGVIIGFLRWVCSGDGFWQNFYGGVDAPLKPYLISTAIITAMILGIAVFTLLFFAGIGLDKDLENRITEYEKREEKRVSDISKSEMRLSKMRSSIQECEIEYRQTKDLLNKYYSLNFIYPKYRGMVPICTIFEYLESGRCFSLLGHEGAYNLYESELRMNRIIEKLDDIIYCLDDISASQRVLANEIKRSNDKIDSMCRSLDNIEQNTALTQYYSSISAANTSYLAWLAYIGHK